jgi:hypothetical protein
MNVPMKRFLGEVCLIFLFNCKESHNPVGLLLGLLSDLISGLNRGDDCASGIGNLGCGMGLSGSMISPLPFHFSI